MKKKICSLILSGGVSHRMGKPKAFLKIGKTTFIEKIISAYQLAGVEKILVVLNPNLFQDKGMKNITGLYNNVVVVCNSKPEKGRFFSIQTGLKELKDFDFCFIQNIDNPFVDADLLNILEKNKNPNGFSVPFFNGRGGHPVLISKKIIMAVNSMKGSDFNLKDVLGGFDRNEVEVPFPGILMNINTKEDYHNFVS